MMYAIDDLPAMARAAYAPGKSSHARNNPELRHACALVSELAYRCGRDPHSDPRWRIRAIPSALFEEIAGHADDTDDDIEAARDHLEALDGTGPYFVVATEFVIVIGIVVQTRLFLGFRGSKGFYDHLYINPQVKRCFWPVANFGRVHGGFLRETTRILPYVQQEIDKLMHKGLSDVIFTGHSLGGAIASIAASCLCPWSWRPTVCTFGAPRFGDAQFRAAMAVLEHTHVQAIKDKVPSLPPGWMGYADNPFPIRPSGRHVRWVARWRMTRLVDHLVRRHSVRRYRMQTGTAASARHQYADILPSGRLN